MTRRHDNLRVVESPRHSLAELNDMDLLHVCTHGNEQAVAVFVRRFQGDVVRFLSRLLGSRDEAIEDLAQLTFVAAIASAHRFQGTSSVRTWLFGIAHNKVKTELRSRKRRRHAMKVFTGLGLVRQTAQAPEVETAELRRRLQHALLELDQDRRATFVLCEVEGMKARQAAVALGTTEGTIWRRLSEARQRLRSKLSDPEVDE